MAKNIPRKISFSRKAIYFILNTFFPKNSIGISRLKFWVLKPIHIRYLQLSLTYDCQCSCVHCGMSKYKNSGQLLSPEEIYRIIDNLVSCGFGQIDFFGGEPLLDKNISKYIKYANLKGIFTHINTNGILLTKETVTELRKSGLCAISISFDSPNSAKHDKNRLYSGAFKSALEGSRLCIANKIKTIMSIYSSYQDINNGETQKLIEIAKMEGFSHVRLLAPFRSGNLSNLDNIDNEREKIIEFVSKNKLKEFIKPHGLEKCFINYKTTAYISPFGDVQPCSMTPFKFGNIRNKKLNKITQEMWKHPLCNIPGHGCLMNSRYIKENFSDIINLKDTDLPIDIQDIVSPQEKALLR